MGNSTKQCCWKSLPAFWWLVMVMSGQTNVWVICTSSYQVFYDVFRCLSHTDFFAGLLTALASPSWLWARADLLAQAGPKMAQPSGLQLLSQAISITMHGDDVGCHHHQLTLLLVLLGDDHGGWERALWIVDGTQTEHWCLPTFTLGMTSPQHN